MSNKQLENSSGGYLRQSFRPFQKATLRGLAVVLPPLLTIVLFIWAWNTIDRFILLPVESLANRLIVWNIQHIIDDSTAQAQVRAGEARLIPAKEDYPPILQTRLHGEFVSVKKTWIHREVYDLVESDPRHVQSASAAEYYTQYVKLRYLQRQLVIPAFLAMFIAVLYLVGKVFAAGVGRLFWTTFESLINRLPIIRNVYSSVKQVTDFAFNETEFHFTRVVAVEYPRKGIWSMGFVTGEGMRDITKASGEPMVNVLMPTSPMPATGFTICVPKSQTVDLNITIDQAIQYCVSCGVVIPEQQQSKLRKLREGVPAISMESATGSDSIREIGRR